MVFGGVYRQGGAYTQAQLDLMKDMQDLKLRFVSEHEVKFHDREEGDPEGCVIDILLCGLSTGLSPVLNRELPIEVDGVSHSTPIREKKDQRKDELLEAHGFRRPLRIPAEELRSKSGRREWLRRIILAFIGFRELAEEP